MMNHPAGLTPQQAAAHLEPRAWEDSNRDLVRKIISEFTHERLLEPEPLNDEDMSERWGLYRLVAGTAGVTYEFRARRLQLDHWQVDAPSLCRSAPDGETRIDACRFILEFRQRIGIGDRVLPEYLEELSSTLYAGAYKRSRLSLIARELIDADFQYIESAMTEGHPTFIANSGRIGFDSGDYRRFAPETGNAFTLVWIGVHRQRVEFACTGGDDYERFVERELDREQIDTFREVLESCNVDPADYVLMPVHPWQWFNKICHVFAMDIAEHYLVCLGYSRDRYQPQQSIRTLFNRTRPDRCYVKTALSVLNMGFMRGLSPDYMSTTPQINDWIHRLVDGDEVLRTAGFTILREVAAIGYRHPHYEQATEKGNGYRKMLAALWRESPLPKLRPGQRIMTMAALLHRDGDGTPVIAELIRASRHDARSWLARYLQCYFVPLLHCFYRHDLVFMPHGENLILVLEDYLPVRCIMKDIAEEIAVMNEGAELPEDVRRIAVPVPDELRVLSIFTDVFDNILRYVAELLLTHSELSEEEFWRVVADCVRDYQAAHPELADKFARHDLFAPEFGRSCLNRLQLANNHQLIDLADPTRTLQFAGTLMNPIAPYRAQAQATPMPAVMNSRAG